MDNNNKETNNNTSIKSKNTNLKKNFFINNMNSKLSCKLLERLRLNKDNNFTGTLTEGGKLPYNFKPKVVEIHPTNNFQDKLFDNNYFIYSLDNSTKDEVEYIVKGLKLKKWKEKKHLIIITNIMTWGRSTQKQKLDNEIYNEDEKNEQDEDKNEDKDYSDSDIIPQDENEGEENKENNIEDNDNQEIRPKPKLYLLNYKDFKLRVPSNKYYIYKSIETLALAASKTNDMLKTYVVCPGFIYGNGEEFFYEYFKRAWLQNQPLPVINSGKNNIPTIHINDLVSLIIKIIENPPNINYILAVDKTKNSTLKNIISSISNSTGDGTILNKNLETNIDDEENTKFQWEELSLINLKFKPSNLFDDERQEDEEEDDFEKRKFKWHAEYGIPENLELLRNEFVLTHKLIPLKILVIGPPGSGKSVLSDKISIYYNIPKINILDIIKYGKAKFKPEESELGDEINKEIEDNRQKIFDKLQEEENKKKDPQELDINKMHIKEFLPYSTIYKILQKMLLENIYKNRGYILDGFPKNYKQSKDAFSLVDEEKAEDDADREYLNLDIFPNTIIDLECNSDEILNCRFKIKHESDVIDTHYNANDMNRRLKLYREINQSIIGEYSNIDFFKQNISIFKDTKDRNIYNKDINIKTIDTSNKNEKEIFEITKLFLEKNGPLKNFMNYESIKENKYSNSLISNLDNRQYIKNEENKLNEFYENNQKSEIAKADSIKKEELIKKEAEILKNKSCDLQDYLNQNVIPILTRGILEICKNCPADPVDELASFLMENSINVPFKDPSKFKNN